MPKSLADTQYPVTTRQKQVMEISFKWKKQKDNIDTRISWSTFGSDYSLWSTWIWRHELYTPGFEDFLLFFSANPLSGWIGTMGHVWLGSSLGSSVAIRGNIVSQQFMKWSQNMI